MAASIPVVILTALSTPVLAASIDLDNNVTIQWEDELAPPISFSVFGAPRLVPNASQAGDLVFLDLDLFFGDDIVFDDGTPKNLIHTIDLTLLVGDSSFEEVIVGGKPLVLTYQVFDGANLSDWFASQPGGVIPLSLFDNFSLLPLGDLVFSVQGEFVGLDSGDITGRVTMAGAGSLVSVPEPGTLPMLLIGVGLVSAARRTTARPGWQVRTDFPWRLTEKSSSCEDPAQSAQQQA